MSKKLIIGLVGQRGSGKSTVAEHLEIHYKAAVRKFSQPLAGFLKIRKVPITRENLQDLATDLREVFGQGILVGPLKKFIEESKAKIVVIDGLRVWEEVKILRSFKNNLLIYISASTKFRFEKMRISGGKDGKEAADFKEFSRLDKKETELLISRIGKKADIVIDNTGTKEELYKKIDKLIKKRIA